MLQISIVSVLMSVFINNFYAKLYFYHETCIYNKIKVCQNAFLLLNN